MLLLRAINLYREAGMQLFIEFTISMRSRRFSRIYKKNHNFKAINVIKFVINVDMSGDSLSTEGQQQRRRNGVKVMK